MARAHSRVLLDAPGSDSVAELVQQVEELAARVRELEQWQELMTADSFWEGTSD